MSFKSIEGKYICSVCGVKVGSIEEARDHAADKHVVKIEKKEAQAMPDCEVEDQPVKTRGNPNWIKR